MPEGDTILRTARALDRALTGKTVTGFETPRIGRHITRPAPGTTITAVEARGKHLLVHFDDGHALHTHMGMPGSWHLYRAGERWKLPAHLMRARIETDDGVVAVCFRAPTVEIVRSAPDDNRIHHDQLDALGPDLCQPDADFDAAVSRLRRLPPGTEIADALLDQRVASGIGNVYKSEALFARGVDPFTPVSALADDSARELFRTASVMLQANVDRGPRRTRPEGGVAVYGRSGRPCVRCGTRVLGRRQGPHARMTYWCPQCQPSGTAATE